MCAASSCVSMGWEPIRSQLGLLILWPKTAKHWTLWFECMIILWSVDGKMEQKSTVDLEILDLSTQCIHHACGLNLAFHLWWFSILSLSACAYKVEHIITQSYCTLRYCGTWAFLYATQSAIEGNVSNSQGVTTTGQSLTFNLKNIHKNWLSPATYCTCWTHKWTIGNFSIMTENSSWFRYRIKHYHQLCFCNLLSFYCSTNLGRYFVKKQQSFQNRCDLWQRWATEKFVCLDNNQ